MWAIQLQDGKGEAQQLSFGKVKIGRDADCDLRLSGWRVSGKHAELFVSNEQGFVRDLASSNGTMVNGKPITTHGPLKPNDKIQIGSHVFTASWVSEAARQVAAASAALTRMAAPAAAAAPKSAAAWSPAPAASSAAAARADVTAPLADEPSLAAPPAHAAAYAASAHGSSAHGPSAHDPSAHASSAHGSSTH